MSIESKLLSIQSGLQHRGRTTVSSAISRRSRSSAEAASVSRMLNAQRLGKYQVPGAKTKPEPEVTEVQTAPAPRTLLESMFARQNELKTKLDKEAAELAAETQTAHTSQTASDSVQAMLRRQEDIMSQANASNEDIIASTRSEYEQFIKALETGDVSLLEAIGINLTETTVDAASAMGGTAQVNTTIILPAESNTETAVEAAETGKPTETVDAEPVDPNSRKARRAKKRAERNATENN